MIETISLLAWLAGVSGAPVPAVDFVSTVDTPYVWELNMWYQTLNCGYSAEFPSMGIAG